MTLIDILRDEFAHETETTQRHLERLPDDKLEWRPHEKSSSAGMLASHLVECVRWTGAIFAADEVNVDPATFKAFEAASVKELLKTFDAEVAAGKKALATASEDSLAEHWSLKIRGKVRFSRPRVLVFRDFTLSHLVHHRGQFTVYLRLLNVPVPGSYGPTADEQF